MKEVIAIIALVNYIAKLGIARNTDELKRLDYEIACVNTKQAYANKPVILKCLEWADDYIKAPESTREYQWSVLITVIKITDRALQLDRIGVVKNEVDMYESAFNENDEFVLRKIVSKSKKFIKNNFELKG